MTLGRHGNGNGIHFAVQHASIDESARTDRGCNFLSARMIDVHDGRETRTWQRRENTRMMPAQVADADDGDTQISHAPSLQSGRPGQWSGGQRS